MLDSINLQDMESGDWARKLATEQLGPVLASLGVEEDPLTFFTDLVKSTLVLQLLTVSVMFYGTEVLGHYNAGG